MKKCPNCAKTYPDDVTYCYKCNHRLTTIPDKKCQKCKKTYKNIDLSHCEKCGTLLEEISKPNATKSSNRSKYNKISTHFGSPAPTSNPNEVRCPKCGSTQITAVQRKWTFMMGFMTNKVDRFCMNCKHKW